MKEIPHKTSPAISRRMIVLELAGAEKRFLDQYVTEGRLPAFQELLEKGKLLKTGSVGVNFSEVQDCLFLTLSPTQKRVLRAFNVFLKWGASFLLAKLQMKVFLILYRQFKPVFATFHLNC